MEFKDVVSISGMGGLFEMIKQRPNGMIVKGLGNNKTQFVSNRIHTFSPLDKIAIYTINDSVPLIDVMLEMLRLDNEENKPPIPPKSSSPDLKKYFVSILSDYDEERVYVSDIKKVIKWYNLLKEHDLVRKPEPVEEEVETEEAVAETEGSAEETTKE